MKKIILLFLSAIFMNMTQAQLYDVISDRDNSKMFRGFITESILKTDSSCKWYSEAQDIYTPKEKVVSTVKQNKDSISFLIFLGTWCEDSHYVVPRIMKILDAAAFPKDKITFVAVDRN
ncbi:MAG TPA: thioredoxin, partial [Niabella sp.]|nr:thioredoxin [Niabella sp.]